MVAQHSGAVLPLPMQLRIVPTTMATQSLHVQLFSCMVLSCALLLALPSEGGRTQISGEQPHPKSAPSGSEDTASLPIYDLGKRLERESV